MRERAVSRISGGKIPPFINGWYRYRFKIDFQSHLKSKRDRSEVTQFSEFRNTAHLIQETHLRNLAAI